MWTCNIQLMESYSILLRFPFLRLAGRDTENIRFHKIAQPHRKRLPLANSISHDIIIICKIMNYPSRNMQVPGSNPGLGLETKTLPI